MRRSSLRLAVVIAAIGLLLVARDAPAADRLDNTRWKVKISPDGEAARAGQKEIDDTLTFKAATFSSAAWAKRGFGPVQYEEDTRGAPGGMQGFSADASSEKEGKAKWMGTATADQISGEMTWVKKDGTELHFTFRGERLPQK
jgi:hypothetical protein